MPATSQIPGLQLTDHFFTVPLEHANPTGQQIQVYAREVVATKHANSKLPWLLFLQGGPGGKSPRPASRSGWIKRATEEYRVLLLDQRGTGRSTPATRQSLAKLDSPEQQAHYLMNFRADSIVRDAEHIRQQLIGSEPWSILGQSYGGFCSLTYLSFAPHGLRESFITGGLAPLHGHPDQVYRLTYQRVREQNRRYFACYPQDQELLQRIANHLRQHRVLLPNGEHLSVQRLQYLGMALGTSDGFETLHYLLEEAFIEGAHGPELSDTFLYGIMPQLTFADHPLFAIMHESIYCQGQASNWSAERIRDSYPEFDYHPGQPFLFTGEMIYPWMFEEDHSLRPLAAAAEILAHYQHWPALYDLEQLRRNNVPVAAAVYEDDMYVERSLSDQTAATVRGCKLWITNEYHHNGLRADGERILDRLIGMVRGDIRV
ncbi:MAG: alpha/beta fold hydrolase [Roseiflexaceae bacterium]